MPRDAFACTREVQNEEHSAPPPTRHPGESETCALMRLVGVKRIDRRHRGQARFPAWVREPAELTRSWCGRDGVALEVKSRMARRGIEGTGASAASPP